MTPEVQHQIHQTIEVVTSSPASVAGVTAGVTISLSGLPMLIQVLTAFVLGCQAAAWIYKAIKWLKAKQQK